MTDLLPSGRVSTRVGASTGKDDPAGAGARQRGPVLGMKVQFQAERGGGDSGGGVGAIGVRGRGDGRDGGNHGGRWLKGHGRERYNAHGVREERGNKIPNTGGRASLEQTGERGREK